MSNMADLPRLRPADRCDRCGAQAFVRVFMFSTFLLFCGHHYAKHELGLAPVAEFVDDQREAINSKPSPTANA